MNTNSAMANSEIDNLAKRVSTLESTMIKTHAELAVYTQRVDMLQDDFHRADNSRNKLQNEMAKVQGGIRTIIFIVSSAIIIEIIIGYLGI